jgi:hypothetical protein
MPWIASDGSLYYVRNERLGQAKWNIVRAEAETILSRLGEFNSDGVLDIEDLRSLSTAIQAGSTDLQFDMDLNGLVDFADRQHWVTEIKKTWIGDANLDGEFNSSDLIISLAAGAYETAVAASWASGDFDGDGDFTSGDLVFALADGGYEAGPRTAVSTVPEPVSLLLLVAGSIGIAIRRRHVSHQAVGRPF